MPSQKTRFGPFLPDVPAFGSPGSQLIKNAFPVEGGYRPVRRVVGTSESLPETPLASVFAKSSAGVSFGFIGGTTRLFRGVGNGFIDASRPGSYQRPFEDIWSFVRFDDRIFASNFSDQIQKFDMRSDAQFASLDAQAPRARFLAVVNRFLVACYLNEDGTISSTGVRWSALDDPENFPVIDIQNNRRSDEAISELSDRQILASEYEEITGIVSGLTSADAVIFQRRGITAMSFSGGDEIFTFNVLEGARGAIANGSIVREGGRAFYISDTGLYVTDGISSIPVGNDRVDDFIFQVLRLDRVSEIRAGIDVQNKLIYWFLPGFDDITLVYNYSIDEFSFIESLGAKIFTRSLTSALTTESIAESFGGVDNMPLSFDDPQFAGSDVPVFSSFTEDNRLGPLSGETLQASLRTPEVEAFDDSRTYLQFTRPLIDTDQVHVIPVIREALQSQPEDAGGSRISGGIATHRVTARYMSLQVEIDAGATWTFAQGIQAIFEQAGNRDPGDIQPEFTIPLFLVVRGSLLLLNTDGQPLLVVDQQEAPAAANFLVTLDGDFLITLDSEDFLVTQA